LTKVSEVDKIYHNEGVANDQIEIFILIIRSSEIIRKEAISMSKEKVISAKEGADMVEQEYKDAIARGEDPRTEDAEYICKNCGHDIFLYKAQLA